MAASRRRSHVWTTAFEIAVAVYFGLIIIWIIEMNVLVYYVHMYSFKLVMICFHTVES